MIILLFTCILYFSTTLQYLADQHFPEESSKLVIDSPGYGNYITMLTGLSKALEASGNISLLKFLIILICREETHVYLHQFQNAISTTIKR